MPFPYSKYSRATKLGKIRNPKEFSSPSSNSGAITDDGPSLRAAVATALPPWGSITGSPPPEPPTVLPFSGDEPRSEKRELIREERES